MKYSGYYKFIPDFAVGCKICLKGQTKRSLSDSDRSVRVRRNNICLTQTEASGPTKRSLSGERRWMSPYRLKRRRLTSYGVRCSSESSDLTKNGKKVIFSSLLRRNFATAKFGFIRTFGYLIGELSSLSAFLPNISTCCGQFTIYDRGNIRMWNSCSPRCGSNTGIPERKEVSL
jgi:hypothetical protein